MVHRGSEEHYYEIHHVVLQPSFCAQPSVFQTIMGMELQLRQANFGSFSQGHVLPRAGMKYEEAKDIISAMCAVCEDKTKEWYVKLPHFQQLGDTSLVTPELYLEDSGLELYDYMLEPTDPVARLPDQDDPLLLVRKKGC